MQTKEKLSRPISIRAFNKSIVLTVLLGLPCLSFGQLEKENTQPYSFENDTAVEYVLTSFVCRYIDEKVYIMWTTLEHSDDCVYVLERSDTGQVYSKLYAKRGAKSPGNIELLYSYTDKKPIQGISYYRLRRLTTEDDMKSLPVIVNSLVQKASVDSIQRKELTSTKTY